MHRTSSLCFTPLKSDLSKKMTTNYLKNVPYTLLNQSSSMESRNSSLKKLSMNARKVKWYNTMSDGSLRTAKHWTHGLNENGHTKGKHNTKDRPHKNTEDGHNNTKHKPRRTKRQGKKKNGTNQPKTSTITTQTPSRSPSPPRTHLHQHKGAHPFV
jgi:hypothetical protein